tara:strand:- start:220 stop:972 length:753 start_codon:yes stop_codon:yes gene_type:complete
MEDEQMTLKKLMLTTAVSAFVATGAFAQTATVPDTGTTTTTEAPMAQNFASIDEMTVGDLLGKSVYEPNGDSIGDIDYVLGNNGSANVVIGIGGFLGLGEYTVAVPLDDLTFNADEQTVQLDTTKEALKELPEFDESDVESLPDETQLSTLMVADDTAAPAATAPADSGSSMGATGDTSTGTMTDDSATDSAPAADADAATDTAPAADAEAATDTAPAADADASADVDADADASTDTMTDEEGAKKPESN